MVHGASRRSGRGRRVIVGDVLGGVQLIDVLLMLLGIVGSLLVVAVVRVELRAQVVDRWLLLVVVVMVLVLRCSGWIVVLVAAGLLRMVRVLALELGKKRVERAIASGASAVASHD